MYIYPNNLKAKPKLWLWELRDIAIIGVGLAFACGSRGIPPFVILLFQKQEVRGVVDEVQHTGALHTDGEEGE